MNILNKMNILYLADHEDTKKEMTIKLKSYVNNILTILNAEDGIELYLKMRNHGITIDTIICDINHLSFNENYEFLKEIRSIDEEVPILLNIDKLEQPQLLKLIKFNISACLTKTTKSKRLLNRIDICGHKYHQNEVIKKQRVELQKIFQAVNNVAIISRTDLKGKITEVNDMFTQTSKYTKSELLGKSHNIIRHPENAKEIFEDMWSTITRGDTWQGSIKNLAKDGTSYFVNTTIFPIYNDLGEDIIEYVAIRFLVTTEEVEKRQFRKKVITNRQKLLKKESEYKKLINSMNLEINKYKQIDTTIFRDKIKTLEKSNISSKHQLNHYESEMKQIIFTRDKYISLANNKLKKTVEHQKQIETKYSLATKRIDNYEEEIKIKEEKIIELESRLGEKIKQVENLFEVIEAQDKDKKEDT